MPTKTYPIAIPDWMMVQMVGTPKNRSQRIQELITKGYLFEQKKQELKMDESAISGILSGELTIMNELPEELPNYNSNLHKGIPLASM